jgi:YihY family inner membrane protein
MAGSSPDGTGPPVEGLRPPHAGGGRVQPHTFLCLHGLARRRSGRDRPRRSRQRSGARPRHRRHCGDHTPGRAWPSRASPDDCCCSGAQFGRRPSLTALLVGTLGCLVTGTTALAQLERGLNRTYGIEEDRPGIRKYGLAFLLTISAGTLSLLAFASLTFGAELFAKTGNTTFKAVWDVVRWPLGLALITVAVTLLLRWCPRRRQPRLSWLAFGSAVSVFLWALVTVGLGLFYRNSKSFGQTYGPLAGIVALQVWCLLSSMALFYGGAVTAQLEAVRAGRPEPQDAAKAAASEPDARNRRVSALVS